MQGSLEKVEFNIELKEHQEEGNIYKIDVKIPMTCGWIDELNFITEERGNQCVYKLDHINNDKEYAYFSKDIYLHTSGRYNYYFGMKVNDSYKFLKKKNVTGDNNINEDEKWEMSVNFSTPDWSKGKMMYQIFVDRFNRARDEELKPMPRRTIHKNWDEEVVIGPDENGMWCTDFYGGNLKGIEEKLDYIKSLGTTIIYLGPVVMSQSNHRYDASDFEKVDPYAGTNEDLKSLCDKAHEKGMKIILDAVFNHTGNDSKYYNEYGTFDEPGAFQGKESKYYNFYKKYYADGKEYCECWNGVPTMPRCNGNDEGWQNYIYGVNGVLDKWFALGIDGVRLDVPDELYDFFIEGIRKGAKRNKDDAFIIGEVWDSALKPGRTYLSSGKGMDATMNYLFTDSLVRYFKYGDVDRVKGAIYEILHRYPEESRLSLMNSTSTHDISRAINIFGSDKFNRYDQNFLTAGNDREWQKNYKLTKEEYERGKEILKAYTFLLAFYPGILSIFYGDEIGLEGMGNLSNRKPFPKGVKDEELLEFFRSIGKIRKEEEFLEKANLEIVDINDKMFMFEREKDNEKAIITVNRTDNEQKLILPSGYDNPDKIYNLNNSNEKELAPHGGLVLKKVRR